MESVLPQLRTDHLTRTLTGPHGLYEHALLDRPRRRLGYTTDDNARALVLLCRGFPDVDAGPYMEFTVAGRTPGGWHNRMTEDGRWADVRGSDDCHGRAIWGLGCALGSSYGDRARSTLVAGMDLDSPHLRANAYATLGAAAAMEAEPDLPGVEAFLRRVSSKIPRPRPGAWTWPESRLTYDNARIPQAIMAAGRALGDKATVDDGLRLLEWLIAVERGAAGFSFTPVAGRGPATARRRGPGFDQQPIEAWGMADACLLALEIAPDDRWAEGLQDAAMWVLGRNDTGAVLYDVATGAGFDGLERDGVNQNRGAESSVAVLGALDALRRHQESPVG